MQIIDYDMPYEQFLVAFDGIHAEWIDGVVYQLPRCSPSHQSIKKLLYDLISSYLNKYPEGETIPSPNLLRFNNVSSARCPDLQILLSKNASMKQGREVVGASDVVIEIISEFDDTQERGDKLIEYEQGGVGEYWIIDPIRQDCLFYVLESRYFRRQEPDQEGIYHSKQLSQFCLPTQFLWSNPSDDKIKYLVDTM